MIIDSHAHLNFEAFEHDWESVIADCQTNEVWMINVGAGLATSRKAAAIAEKYERGVYAAIGLHPIHVSGSDWHPEAFNIDEYRALAKSSKKIVAFGETGIDFFHSDKNLDNQRQVFIKHLNLAKEFALPLIIHCRNSKDQTKDGYNEILAEIREQKSENRNQRTEIKGVIHCFGGNVKQALAFSQLGFYVGFTGIITFDKTGQLAEVIKNLSLDSILIETDSPYLAPEPHRGKRNQPQYVKHVAEKIAELKQIDYNKVVEQTAENTIRLFNLR